MDIVQEWVDIDYHLRGGAWEEGDKHMDMGNRRACQDDNKDKGCCKQEDRTKEGDQVEDWGERRVGMEVEGLELGEG